MRTRLRPLGAIFIALTAICLQRAGTLPWAAAVAASVGSATAVRAYDVSPIGVMQSSPAPGQSPESCRWWPKMGAAELCTEAPQGAEQFRRLRMAYPLLATAMWVAVIALFLQVLRLPRWPIVRATVTWGSTALSVAAIAVMCLALPGALAVLAGSVVRWSGSGFVFACTASVLSLLSGLLALTPGPERSAAAG